MNPSRTAALIFTGSPVYMQGEKIDKPRQRFIGGFFSCCTIEDNIDKNTETNAFNGLTLTPIQRPRNSDFS